MVIATCVAPLYLISLLPFLFFSFLEFFNPCSQISVSFFSRRKIVVRVSSTGLISRTFWGKGEVEKGEWLFRRGWTERSGSHEWLGIRTSRFSAIYRSVFQSCSKSSLGITHLFLFLSLFCGLIFEIFFFFFVLSNRMSVVRVHYWSFVTGYQIKLIKKLKGTKFFRTEPDWLGIKSLDVLKNKVNFVERIIQFVTIVNGSLSRIKLWKISNISIAPNYPIAYSRPKTWKN